ncbi:MAG: SurA N-terminal domain-containing protein [Spirochaetales bacterium]|nr:SurA N-terminal domain-containing protein [Spirochaetales bacterium]
MSKDTKSNAFQKKGVKHHRNIGVLIGTSTILVITIVAFILVPALSQSGSSANELVFGRYGKTKIDYVPGNYFARQIEYINNIYRDSDSFSDNVEYKRQLVWQTAFNQTVIQKAIEDNLHSSGLTISDKQIDRAVVERGPFKVDGVFDEDSYRNASTQVKFDLKNQLKEELLREQYLTDVMYGAFRNDNMLDFIAKMGSDEKKFNYAVFNIDSLDPDFFKSYASANLSKFAKASLNKITIYTSQEAADNLLQRIRNEEISFRDAAIAESQDSFASEGGNAGELYFYEVLNDVESEESVNSVFALEDREVSPVIKTTYGWVLYQMISTPFMPDLESAELIDDVKVYMSRNEKGLIEDSLVAKGNEFSQKLENNRDFLSTAISMNIENGTSGFFAVNYGNNRMIPSSITNATNQDPAFASAAYDELFLERLFSLSSEGEVSDPLVLGNNIIVAQLAGTQESTAIPEESMAYYKYQIESEITGYMQSDLQNVVLASDKLENNFLTTYARIFYAN